MSNPTPPPTQHITGTAAYRTRAAGLGVPWVIFGTFAAAIAAPMMLPSAHRGWPLGALGIVSFTLGLARWLFPPTGVGDRS